MPTFSERYNLKPKKMIQINDIDDDLYRAIWNVFYLHFYQKEIDTSELFDKIWVDFLKHSVDTYPGDPYSNNSKPFVKTIKDGFSFGYLRWEWWKVYDFLEFLVENTENNQNFQDDCNKVFEKECSGYRFLKGLITPITSEKELDEIERAIQISPETVKNHLTQALILLSNRQSPDFRNSIKESISAVEAQCQIICEEPTSTLTQSLKVIKRSGKVKIHPDLNEAFQKIYSWTNDDEGIRHALKDMPTVDQEDAQFMLVACSAFINYLQVKRMKSIS
jgi:hypothetical protein